MWQDLLISGVCFAFGFMLIPQLMDSFKGKSYINVYTAFMTIIAVVLLAIAFASLDMWFATISEIIAFVIWVVLFWLSLRSRLGASSLIS